LPSTEWNFVAAWARRERGDPALWVLPQISWSPCCRQEHKDRGSLRIDQGRGTRT
ncbi:unnamed protein product, partial [Scytosiphon promiscuus]